MTDVGSRIRRALIALLLLAFTAHAGGVLSLAQAAPAGDASGVASPLRAGEPPLGETSLGEPPMIAAPAPAPGNIMAMPGCQRVTACTPYILPDGPRIVAPHPAPVERAHTPVSPPKATAMAIETPPPR